MFQTNQNQTINIQLSSVKEKQSIFARSINRSERTKQISQLRKLNQMNPIKFLGTKLENFQSEVQSTNNAYSLMLTILLISQQINWRSWIPHLQTCIRRFHNICTQQHECLANLLHMQNFQQRFANLLYLGDIKLQEHLRLLVSILLAYNSKYFILNEQQLSSHILAMERYCNGIYWLLARCSTSILTMEKILKKNNINEINLLPILTISSNFVVDSPTVIVQSLIQNINFQSIIQNGLYNKVNQIAREAMLLVNNLSAKSQKCFQYLMSQNKLIQHIQTISNQQTPYFLKIIEIRMNQTS